MDIVKVSIMGICGMMLGFILKETRPEFACTCNYDDRFSDPWACSRKGFIFI